MMDKFVNKINNDNETDASLYIENNRKKACPNEEEVFFSYSMEIYTA